jgi:hypothetical protein
MTLLDMNATIKKPTLNEYQDINVGCKGSLHKKMIINKKEGDTVGWQPQLSCRMFSFFLLYISLNKMKREFRVESENHCCGRKRGKIGEDRRREAEDRWRRN